MRRQLLTLETHEIVLSQNAELMRICQRLIPPTEQASIYKGMALGTLQEYNR